MAREAAMRPRDIGNVSVAPVLEAEGPLLEAAMVFPDWNPDAVKDDPWPLAPQFYDAERSLLVIAIQSFLLKTRRHTILVDACIGNDKERNNPHFSRLRLPWIETLARAGARPEDIDIVLCTHMHVDHVGWNTRLENGRWVPTFPNARYLFAKREWEHWERVQRENGLTRTGDYIGDSVLPVMEAGKADLVATDHEIEPGIWLDHMPGHTPGQVAVHVKSGRDEAIFTGDMMHHPVQCARPDWSTNFCTDRAQAADTRRKFLDRYADANVLVVPSHFPGASSGYVERGKGRGYGFRFD
jgi:glyoxylase-like metal-dependent hydrolase (beta-lactamase superfamily II)